ncbi:LexA repressor [Paenibacillus albilobatus]|uniref:LexA repressor n=1 Tax=Paenibacillus albilobatus TaxID=2716884 RepID=A0A919XMF6_9BACL|nr:S24 family peptidase [Paenibacillus albilobatus]GIO33095.1 LexA repressor [Paenibacillus albilobatus]
MARKKYTEVEKDLMKGIAKNLRMILTRKGLSQKELAEGTELSTSVISDYLNEKTLATPGSIQKIADFLKVSKSEIDPTFKSNSDQLYTFNKIPLVGTICAGEGLLAEQNIEDYVYYPFPNKKQPDFALRVKGDSMIGAGIESGDIVYIKAANWAEYNGQIVAALINDCEEGMLKRIKWTEGSAAMQLIPENDKYEIKELHPSEFKICGIYMGHFKPVEE